MGAAVSDYFASYADISDGYLDEELAFENFHEICAKGEFHEVSIWLKRGLDPNGLTFDDVYEREDTPLICTARGHYWKKGTKRHIKTMEILFKFGAKIDQWNMLEQTPLYVACDRNLFIIVQWLVEHGADVNKSSKVGISPLHCACRNQNAEMVKYLLEHGARALPPPKIFSSIKPPTVLDEIKQQEEKEEEEEEEEEKEKKKEGGDNGTAKVDKDKIVLSMSKKERISALKEEIDQQIKKEQDKLKEIMEEVEEEKIREKQEYYRRHLAQEIKNRKEKRRKAQEKALYQRYLAQIEQKRKEQIGKYLEATTQLTEEEKKTEKSSMIPTLPIDKIKSGDEIAWTKETKKKKKRNSQRHGSASRPFKWMPEIAVRCGLRTAGGTSSSYNQKNENTPIPTVASAAAAIIQQCQELYLTIQYTTNRRLRIVHTAPDAEMYRSSALYQKNTRQDEEFDDPMMWKRPDTAPAALSSSMY